MNILLTISDSYITKDIPTSVIIARKPAKVVKKRK